MTNNLKKGLTGLGISVIIAGGIYTYFNRQTDYLTYEEYKSVIEAYNTKLQDIRLDCKNDVRCKDGKVIFRGVRDKKEVVEKLNAWIKEDNKNPQTYKLKRQ